MSSQSVWNGQIVEMVCRKRSARAERTRMRGLRDNLSLAGHSDGARSTADFNSLRGIKVVNWHEYR